MVSGLPFEGVQQPPPDTEPSRCRRHPHALDLCRVGTVELQPAATDRLVAQARDQEQPWRLGQLLRIGRDAPTGIEAGLESRVELGEVGLEATPSGGTRGLSIPITTSPAVRSRSTMLIASTRRARCSSSSGSSNDHASSSLRRSSTSARPGRPCQPSHPSASIVAALLDDHQPFAPPAAQEPTQVAGVEVEPRPQRPHVDTLRSDLPQHPRCAERTAARQVLLAEGTDSLRHRAVETPDALCSDRIQVPDSSQTMCGASTARRRARRRGRGSVRGEDRRQPECSGMSLESATQSQALPPRPRRVASR